jgi:hypothetical protein
VALLASDLLERASRLLNDESRVRWTSSELIEWINDGMYAICAEDPSAYSDEVVVPLVAGVRQTLPASATKLLTVEYNTTDMSVVTPCDRVALDAAIPDWRSTTYANAHVTHYMYDSKVHPTEFLVYPAQPVGTTSSLTAVVAKNPPPATAAATLALDEKYREALLDYMLFRAFSKDAEEGNAALAGGHYTAFVAAMKRITGNVAQ